MTILFTNSNFDYFCFAVEIAARTDHTAIAGP